MERRPVDNTGIVRGHDISKSASQEEREHPDFFSFSSINLLPDKSMHFSGSLCLNGIPMITSALHGVDVGSVLFHKA